MKKLSLIDKYLQHYSTSEKWDLIANDTENISQVVVIPAYAEREMLFHTLASIAKNPPSSLEYSFILCVINNKDNSSPAVIENNRQTMEYLDALVKKKPLGKVNVDQRLYSLLLTLSDAKLKLGYINASSKGYEIPQNLGGVGTARKIGMDMALHLLKKSSTPRNLIISLDADTLVQNNYLSAIRNYFIKRVKTAIVAYEHQMPLSFEEQAAICCYEIFLRYWVLGLKYAKSPWAFHSIGSTIVTTTESYLEVRGMNKREAGEDFYFLSKLAKIGKIGYIKETCVYPSSRPSARVPFGTGKRIQRFLAGVQEDEYLLYDPYIFVILADWLQLMNDQFICGEDEILIKTKRIHPTLTSFLKKCDFATVWSKICRNAKDEKTLKRHFNDWFDGFKTLKLINYFTKEVYPQINMFDALDRILSMSGISELKLKSRTNILQLEEQMKILQYLRKIT
jgi:glycosyltransferase involved in cell wall biosynthesis